jgi:hypothetical protein
VTSEARPTRRLSHGALSIASLLVAAGIALRIAILFPSHRYQTLNADKLLSGIGAVRLLHGHLPFFFATPRWGAISSYVLAPFLLVFGVSRSALAAGNLLIVLTLFGAWILFLRTLLGTELALAALPFAALPPAVFSQFCDGLTGYPELLALCAITLWLAARLGREESRWVEVLGFGVAVGLGWWTSLLSLSCTAPALMWLCWKKRDSIRSRPLSLLVLVGGILLGALPWSLFHLRYRLGPFFGNYAAHLPHSSAATLEAGWFLLVRVVPELLASRFLYRDTVVPSSFRLLVLTVSVMAILLCMIWVPWARLRARRATLDAPDARSGRRELVDPAAWSLCALVVLVTLGFHLVSDAFVGLMPSVHRLPPEFVDSQLSLGTRFLFPAYLVVPAMFALVIARCGPRGRWVATFLTASIVIFNVVGVALPWTPLRLQLRQNAADEALVLRELTRQHVDGVIGDYRMVYPFNFLSGEALRGVPLQPEDDYFKEAERVPSNRPSRLILLASSEGELSCWSVRAALAGKPRVLADGWVALLPPIEIGAGVASLEKWRARLMRSRPERDFSPASCRPDLVPGASHAAARAATR